MKYKKGGYDYDARDAEFFFDYGREPWHYWDLFMHVITTFGSDWSQDATDFLHSLADEEIVEALVNFDEEELPSWMGEDLTNIAAHRLLYRSLEEGMENP